MAADQLDMEAIYELMSRFEQSGIGEMKLSMKEFSVEIKKPEENTPTIIYRDADPSLYLNETYSEQTRQGMSLSPASVKAGGAAEDPMSEMPELSADTGDGDFIRSPVVGTFYEAPGEGEAPFVRVGDTVKRGQTVCIVEAMKMMNEIGAEYDCVIEEVMCHNADAVGYKEKLFRVRKR